MLKAIPGLPTDTLLILFNMIDRHDPESNWAPLWASLPEAYYTGAAATAVGSNNKLGASSACCCASGRVLFLWRLTHGISGPRASLQAALSYLLLATCPLGIHPGHLSAPPSPRLIFLIANFYI